MNDLFKQEFLTQKAVAGHFKVSTNTIRNWEKRGLLSAWRVPGSTHVLYLSVEVRELSDNNLKPRRGGDSPKPLNGMKKGRPVVSPKSDEDWRI
jgi:hypothetical protein